MRQVSPEVRSFAMSPGPRSEIAFCSWSSMISSYTGPVTAASTPIGTGKSGAKRSARSFAAFTLVSSWTQSALAATSFALTTFGRTPSMMTARRSACGPKSRGLPGSSRSSYWSFCSLSYITFHARSLYTLQFWRISTNAAPLWWAARLNISSMCAMLRSTVRATKEMLRRAAHHKGAAFVEILQNCNVYNDLAWNVMYDKEQKLQYELRLEHGKPLLFGPQDDRRAVIMDGVRPKVVTAKDVPASALWVHDESNVNAAKLLADLFAPDFPVPIGVLAAVAGPVYEEIMLDQEQKAISERGPGDIAKLLTSGDTWRIS